MRVAGVIGLRGPDIAKRDALRGYKVEWKDADRPLVRPHTGLPVLTLDNGEPKVERHVFGFSRKFSSFNARDDRLVDGKMWKPLFGDPKHHGVAPVSYIMEWADLGDGRGRVPLRIERADGAAMAVPALTGAYWEDRKERAFALVTITPNEFFGSFHDRMTASLRDEDVDRWLHAEGGADKLLKMVQRPPPNDELVAYPLDKKATPVKMEAGDLLHAVGPAIRWTDVQRGALRKRAPRQATL